MRSLLHKLACTLALTLLLAIIGAAQQPAVGRQKSPKLTTDDVRPVSEQPVETKDAVKPEGIAKPEDAASTDANGKPDQARKPSSEEAAWRDRVAKAREKAKRLEKATEEAELRITALRNDLSVSGQSARQRNDTAAEIGQTGQRLNELRAEARAAADDADQLSEYGKQKGYSEAEEQKATSGDGKPNEEYYRTQFTKLTESLDTAQRRVQLYDDRVRDLNQQISINSGGKDKNGRGTGGDTFFAMQLAKDRDDAQEKLNEARSALTKAHADLDALREEARRAGVPPGVFR